VILIWKGEKLGEITAPTIKEMRVVKRDLGISNPLTFMDKAANMATPKPKLDAAGAPIVDARTGKPAFDLVPNESFDTDCLAMMIALLMTRQGRPTEMEDIDGDLAADLRMEATADEKAKFAAELGKAGLPEGIAGAILAPTTTSGTSTP
jgi:hypothetical protein